MGSRLLSVKSDAGWRGKTTLSVNDRGERRFLKLENCFVSSDGSEIRQFPGYALLWNGSETNTHGYAGYVEDAVKPIFATSPSEIYPILSYKETGRMLTMKARAKPVHFHGFEQVGDTTVIWGESRFREVPCYSTIGNVLTPAYISVTSGRWVLHMDGSVAAMTTSDDSGAGLNALAVDNTIYVEDLTVADATLQGYIDTNLNGRVHEVKAISGAAVTLHTTSGGTATQVALTDGSFHKVRPSRSNVYSTPSGIDPYDTDDSDRPDDPDALTAWRIVLPLLYNDSTAIECYPAWVANRRRDFGDGLANPSTPYMDVEGIFTSASKRRGVSRREQRKLPYRTNSEAAQDRIVLAAPGYGCMFQIPLKVPINPQNWPFDPETTLNNYGMEFNANSIYDMPRALGIPKARLIDSIYTPAPPSPNIYLPGAAGYSFNAVPFVSDSPDSLGLPPGEYLVSIAFEDEALGEEGLASEPIEVTIPANDYGYSIRINYIHPAYVMPECLAMKANVYIAPPGETAMAYYTSFQLGERPDTSAVVEDQSYEQSSFYGFPACSPDDARAIFRGYTLPLPGDRSDLSEVLDAERLAPQSASMPRGSEACRYIRGVLLAGGNTGNEGGSLQLWAGLASIIYDGQTHTDTSELTIRVRSTTNADIPEPSGNADGDQTDSTLGTAGRYFPDAYQGIEVTSHDLFPAGSSNQQIDRVINPKSVDLTGTFLWHHDRLQMARDILGRTRDAGSPFASQGFSRLNRTVWYRMPKGQLQVGDPGAPGRSSKAAIQFIDPNRGDDITAIGNLAGTAIICSRRETYSMAWYRFPNGEVPQLLSNEHGCIAANSMVEFDGGVAWIGSRGPVAMGGSLTFIGDDVKDDFVGPTKRYLHDQRGMMRHCWGAHDSIRGLVLWGMVTSDNDLSINYEGNPNTTWSLSTDEAKSRFPCDEVLVWSYKTNSFSTWVPPQPIFWMREVRIADGSLVMAFLAEDGNLYYLKDSATNPEDMTIVSTYIGGETMDNLNVQAVQMRYTLVGTGSSEAKVYLQKTEYEDDGSLTTTNTDWEDIGTSTLTVGSDDTWRLGQRRRFLGIGIDGEEVAVKLQIRGSAQVRIADLSLEVG